MRISDWSSDVCSSDLTYSSLEALGICTIDAGSQNSIPDMAKLYREIGKRVFAICDKQDAANKALIEAQVDVLLMHDEKGFEDLVLKNTTEEALKRFAKLVYRSEERRVGEEGGRTCR